MPLLDATIVVLAGLLLAGPSRYAAVFTALAIGGLVLLVRARLAARASPEDTEQIALKVCSMDGTTLNISVPRVACISDVKRSIVNNADIQHHCSDINLFNLGNENPLRGNEMVTAVSPELFMLCGARTYMFFRAPLQYAQESQHSTLLCENRSGQARVRVM
jgi:hypothetical protein